MIWLITPLLGSVRNFVKYKEFKPFVFIRSPLLYILIFLSIQTTNVWKILMIERWIMFVYKTILSLYRKDYIVKKEKYIQKYNLKYKEYNTKV